MTLVYQAIHAALLPIALHEVPHFLDVFCRSMHTDEELSAYTSSIRW
jgi:hypothetical protein